MNVVTTNAAPERAGTKPAVPKRKRRSDRHEALTGWAFLAPFAILFALVFLIPIGVSVVESFYKKVPAGGGLFGGGDPIRTFVGFDNYARVAESSDFWAGIGRVVLYAAIQIPIMIGLALALALLLDSFTVRRPGFFRLSFFLPYAIPGVVAAMVWLFLYTPSLSTFFPPLPEGDLARASGGMILALMANMTTWTYTGYNMLIFLAALKAIPGDIYEAARIDGATGWQINTKIKIPMVRNAALLAVLLSIIGTIQLFNEPTVMSTSIPSMGTSYTPMMMAFSFRNEISGVGFSSAISVMMALIAGVLAIGYALLQKKAD